MHRVLQTHALVIGLVFGLGFTLAVLGGGPWLYGAMGGRGASLAAALTSSPSGVKARRSS